MRDKKYPSGSYAAYADDNCFYAPNVSGHEVELTFVPAAASMLRDLVNKFTSKKERIVTEASGPAFPYQVAFSGSGFSLNYVHTEPESFASKQLKFLNWLKCRQQNGESFSETKSFKSRSNIFLSNKISTKFNTVTKHFGGRPVIILSHTGAKPDKHILFLHGGVFNQNKSDKHWEMVQAMVVGTQAAVIIPDYPLAPANTFDEALRFLNQVYAELIINDDVKDVVFVGEGYGASLALEMAQSTKINHFLQPSQLILISPMLQSLNFKWSCEPISRFTAFGKISIFTSGEQSFLLNARKLRELLLQKEASINYFEYPKMHPAWLFALRLPEARKALLQIKFLIKSKPLFNHTGFNALQVL